MILEPNYMNDTLRIIYIWDQIEQEPNRVA